MPKLPPGKVQKTILLDVTQAEAATIAAKIDGGRSFGSWVRMLIDRELALTITKKGKGKSCNNS